MLAAYIIKSKIAERVYILVGNEALIERDHSSFSSSYESLKIKSGTKFHEN
jgi:hypothetical protein